MRFQQYLKRMKRYLSPGSRKQRPKRAVRRLELEPLEDRTVPAVSAVFDWEMAERFGHDSDNNGRIDLLNSYVYAHPLDFKVTLDASASSGASSYQWLIVPKGIGLSKPVEPIVTTSSKLDVNLAEGLYTVTLTAVGAGAEKSVTTQDVRIRDLLIVAIGDSAASGEGNPEVYAMDEYGRYPAQWADDQAVYSSNGTFDGQTIARESHRSTKAAAAQAALDIENADPHTSVTFIFLAASGSDVFSGLINSKNGIENSAVKIPPQLETLKQIVGFGTTAERRIDALYVSIGINDIGFASVVEDLVAADPTLPEVRPDKILENLTKTYGEILQGIVARAEDKLSWLPARYYALAEQFRTLNVSDVYITEYPDPFFGDDGQRVNELMGDLIVGYEIDQNWRADEIAIGQSLLNKLNTAVQTAADTHGWNFVGGIDEGFRSQGGVGHGYKASKENRWIRTAEESHSQQGPFDNKDTPLWFLDTVHSKGTLHPNEEGHKFIRDRLLESIQFNITLDSATDRIDVIGTEGSDRITIAQKNVVSLEFPYGQSVIEVTIVNGLTGQVVRRDFETYRVDSITVDSHGGDDVLTVDFNAGSLIPLTGEPLPWGGITYFAGQGNDRLEMSGGYNPFGATFSQVSYAALGADSGGVLMDAGRQISYAGVEDIADKTSAAYRVFAMNHDGPQSIRIKDLDNASDTALSTIDSNGTQAFTTVTFAHPTNQLFVGSGDGADSIVLDPLDPSFHAAIVLQGEAGIDTVIFNDQTNPYGDAYTINSTSVSRTNSAPVTYSDIERLTVNAGIAANHIDIQGTLATTLTTVNGGNGLDTILISDPDAIDGQLSVNGQGDGATLQVYDRSHSRGLSWTISSSFLVRDSLPLLDYATLSSLRIEADNGSNTFNIQSTLATTPVTVNAGGGNDVFNVHFPSGIAGALTLNGESGVLDALNLNEQGADTGRTYNLTASTLKRSGSADITYAALEKLSLKAGRGIDTFTVAGTAVNSITTIEAGDANDIVSVGDAANRLDSIRGELTIDGQVGGCRLTINDQGYVGLPGTIGNYYLTDRKLESNRAAYVNFFAATDLTLNAGRASVGNNIYVRSTAAGSRVRVNTGPLNDSAYVGSTDNRLNSILGELTIDGQGAPGIGGVDLHFNDTGTTTAQTYTLTATDLRSLVSATMAFLGASVTINAGLLGDTLNVTSLPVGQPVTFKASGGSDTVSGPNIANTWTLTSNGYGNLNNDALKFELVETLKGGTAVDTIVGPNVPTNTWLLTSSNGGNLNNGDFTFSSMEKVKGGANTDTLTGPDTENRWTMTGTNAGNLNNGSLGFESIENLTGGRLSLGDTLVGANTNNTWKITDTNVGSLNAALTFKSMENLAGGTGTDEYIFQGTWLANGTFVGGMVDGSIDGGAGFDKLNFKDFPQGQPGAWPTFFKLTAAGARDGFNGTSLNNIRLGFANINEVIAPSTGTTTLTGTDLASTWELSSLNSGAVTLTGSGNRINFSSFKNLTAGGSDDTFKISNGVGTLLSGNLRGGLGVNTLDYSQHSSLNPVSVDLPFSRASRVGGFATDIHNVIGGAGNDSLTGNGSDNLLVGGAGNDLLVDNSGGYDILLGGAGNDKLRGGFGIGRSIMVGGTGADDLLGTGSEDLLIGGKFRGESPYYNESTGAINRTALNAIMTEWKAPTSIDARISRLENTAPYLLNAATVADDLAVDTLAGGAGSDWIIHSFGDGLSEFLTGTDRKKEIY